jgi:hypothetical protein
MGRARHAGKSLVATDLIRRAGLAATALSPAAAFLLGPGMVARGVPASGWPALVRQAMAYAAPRTRMPLEAPRRLPETAGGVANSAQARAGADSYEVTLYRCSPHPLGLNSPGIGRGSCGAMASVYGSFGGQELPDAAKASASLPRPPARRGCPRSTRVALGRGVVATAYSGDPVPPGPRLASYCEATWVMGRWSFFLSGDLSGATGAGTLPWTSLARGEVAYFSAHPVRAEEGIFSADVAGDGIHTTLAWRNGDDVYNAGLYHGDVGAIALAASLAPYPGGRR